MKDKTKEQKARIMKHLLRYGMIKPAYADNVLRVPRLSEIIRRLRNDGIPIVTELGKSKQGGRYTICYKLVKY